MSSHSSTGLLREYQLRSFCSDMVRDGTGCQEKQAKGKGVLPSARSWQRRRRHPRRRQLPPLSLPRDDHKHHRRGPKGSVRARQEDHAHLTRSWSYGGEQQCNGTCKTALGF
jgi:hypothetical protein